MQKIPLVQVIEFKLSIIINKQSNNENLNVDEIKDKSSDDNSKLVDDDTKDEDVDDSIESVPFISEPVKKKRARSQK